MQQQSPSDADARADATTRAVLAAARPPDSETAEAVDTQSTADRETAPSDSADLDSLAAEIQALGAAIDELSEQHSPPGQPTAAGEPAGLTFEWVDEPANPAERRALAERVATLETQLAAVAEAAAGISELETAVDSQQTAYESLDDRLETELDGVETVLQTLLDRTETLAERVDALSESHAADLEPLEHRLSAQRALRSLTQEALRHGISEAACHHCDHSVDIGMLELPVCPSCGRRFVEVESGGWWPLSTATLRTTGRPPTTVDCEARPPTRPE